VGSVTLLHVGYDYMSFRLAHDQTLTGCSGSIMGCTQDVQDLQDAKLQLKAGPLLPLLTPVQFQHFRSPVQMAF